ncbi:hypothetical protein CHLNCDRAFT_139196 [Chlorella variabilis]|uniref:Apple domain-containing protein n=1 Tax=Chlorella variabilis TaxID=554065 RepID=E1ZPG0_CHLVA|nr:hypothetical protein CHLNCDRAFT_139196 [Chlorella variabilis]EFN52270.1 hypothetical protein CHLNCDRAFT_139196 [Chlorella variabilis]|eukprot:XP_005844372.1 hypothetical protein CHLNCDRAFT_139196 [Chlorella variabilis]
MARLTDFEIHISRTRPFLNTCDMTAGEDGSATYDCQSGPLQGRFVSIQIVNAAADSILTLCEVQVFGATKPPTGQRPGPFDFQTGIDYPTSTIMSTTAPTLEDCHAECSSAPRCLGWVAYVMPGSEEQYSCLLKDTVHSPSLPFNRSSNTVFSYPPISSTGPLCLGTYGADHSALSDGYDCAPAASPGECCTRCQGQLPRCQVWNYQEENRVGVGRNGTCCLKDAFLVYPVVLSEEQMGEYQIWGGESTCPPPSPPPPSPAPPPPPPLATVAALIPAGDVCLKYAKPTASSPLAAFDHFSSCHDDEACRGWKFCPTAMKRVTCVDLAVTLDGSGVDPCQSPPPPPLVPLPFFQTVPTTGDVCVFYQDVSPARPLPYRFTAYNANSNHTNGTACACKLACRAEFTCDFWLLCLSADNRKDCSQATPVRDSLAQSNCTGTETGKDVEVPVIDFTTTLQGLTTTLFSTVVRAAYETVINNAIAAPSSTDVISVTPTGYVLTAGLRRLNQLPGIDVGRRVTILGETGDPPQQLRVFKTSTLPILNSLLRSVL